MTEKANPDNMDFDLWSSLETVEAIFNDKQTAISKIKPQLQLIAKATEKAADNLKAEGRLVYVGAGTSGRLAIQDGAELTPTFGWPKEKLVFGMAGGLEALAYSVEGAEDNEGDGNTFIKSNSITKNDVVICVAASGKTPFTLGALREANLMGATTISIVCNKNTPILEEADFGICIETGSEPVAGSTRMKAGTVQKIVLNMLSTAIMNKLGHIYKSLMVSMQITNKKLEKRAVKMVGEIANCPTKTAQKALNTANNNIKLASLIALGQNMEKAKSILSQNDGNLRDAISHIKNLES